MVESERAGPANAGRVVASEGAGRWQGCDVLGPNNDASPPAMIITCDDGRRLSRVEVPRGQFTQQAYRDNVDRFIENALGFHVRPESTTLTLADGQEARVARLVTRMAGSGSESAESETAESETAESETAAPPSTDVAMTLAGVFVPGDNGTFITCSRLLDGPRGEHDFDGCDADIRALVQDPPWPGFVPERG